MTSYRVPAVGVPQRAHLGTGTLAAVTALAGLAGSWVFPPIWVLLAYGVLVIVLACLRFPVFGFCLLALSVPWGGGFTVPLGAPVSSTELVVGAVSVAWLFSAVSERRPILATRLWLPFIAVFLVVICASASQASDQHASLREILKWGEMTAVFCAAAYFLRSERDLMMVVAAMVLAGLTQALLGYVQFFLHLGPAAFVVHGSFLRAYGTFDQPNPFAGYLNLVLPLAVASAILLPIGWEKRLHQIAAMVIAGGLLLSESRGALLASFLAVAVIISVLSRRVRFLAWTGIVLGLAGGLLALFGLVPEGPFAKLLDTIGLGGVSFGHVTDANFSAVERAAHWLAGVRMFAAHPLLGVGIGNYAAAYPAYHPRGWYDPLEHAHNYYINIAAEAGVFGLTSYVLLIGSALWYSCAALGRALTPRARAAVLGVLGALVATDFHNLFDVLYVHGMTTLIGLEVALIVLAVRVSHAEPERRRVVLT
jgi:O-antigen ligase